VIVQRIVWQFMSAALLGLVSAVACVGSVQEGGADARRKSPPEKQAPAAADASAEGGLPRCLHGALEDPHRGFVRCLEPGEADAGWLPPAPQPEVPPPDAGAADGGITGGGATDGGAVDAGPPPTSTAPPVIEIGEPAYENGDVPRVPKILQGITGKIARCVADNGGLAGPTGSIKVQFLVRSRGRAEGVEILSAKGISASASGCVRLLLKNKAVGSPTADPVGVTVTFSLKAPPK
jgi:hypothetical protein